MSPPAPCPASTAAWVSVAAFAVVMLCLNCALMHGRCAPGAEAEAEDVPLI